MLSQFAIKGLSHITGGGLTGNTMRVVPKGLQLNVDWQAWPVPPIFEMIVREGNVPVEDARRTLNMGIGLVIIAAKNEADKISAHLTSIGETHFTIGEITNS